MKRTASGSYKREEDAIPPPEEGPKPGYVRGWYYVGSSLHFRDEIQMFQDEWYPSQNPQSEVIEDEKDDGADKEAELEILPPPLKRQNAFYQKH